MHGLLLQTLHFQLRSLGVSDLKSCANPICDHTAWPGPLARRAAGAAVPRADEDADAAGRADAGEGSRRSP